MKKHLIGIMVSVCISGVAFAEGEETPPEPTAPASVSNCDTISCDAGYVVVGLTAGESSSTCLCTPEEPMTNDYVPEVPTEFGPE